MAHVFLNKYLPENFGSLPLLQAPIITEEVNTHTLKRALTELDGNAVPFNRNNEIVGFFRLHDLMRALSLKEEKQKQFLKKNFSNKHITVEANEAIFSHLDRILAGPNGPIIVTESNKFLGYIHRHKLLEILLKKFTLSLESIPDQSKFITIQENASIYTTFKAMHELSVDVAAVVDQEGVLIGVFTNSDLPTLIGDGYDLWNTRINSAMKEPAFVTQTASLTEAYQVILRTGKKLLIIVDNEGHPKGVVDDKAISEALYQSSFPISSSPTPYGINNNSRHLPESLIIETALNRTIKTGIIGVDEDLNIIYLNPASKKFLNDNECLSLKNHNKKQPMNMDDSKYYFKHALSEAIKRQEKKFIINTKGNKRNKYIQCKLSPIQQGQMIIGHVIAMQDVTDQKNNEEAIKLLAYYDTLTKLPNRLLFNERMAIELKRVKRSHEQLALMVLDLDGFKNINDQHGHIAGDKLLQIISQRLTKTIRESDTVSRIGGDEFTFIFPKIHSHEDMKALNLKIKKAVKKPVKINNDTVTVSASTGVAFFPNDGKTIKTLFKKADNRMFKEKALNKQLTANLVASTH